MLLSDPLKILFAETFLRIFQSYAAIDDELDTRDIAALIACKIERAIGHIPGIAPEAHGNLPGSRAPLRRHRRPRALLISAPSASPSGLAGWRSRGFFLAHIEPRWCGLGGSWRPCSHNRWRGERPCSGCRRWKRY